MASDLKSSGKGGYKPKPKRKPRQTGREAPRAGPGPPQPKPAPPPKKRDIKAGEKSVVSQGRPYRGAPPARPKPRKKPVPIVTEHTRGQANAIDRNLAPVPFQGRQGPVARPEEGHGKAFANLIRAYPSTMSGLGQFILANTAARQDIEHGRFRSKNVQQAGALNFNVAKALALQAKHDVENPTDPMSLVDFGLTALAVPGAVGRGVMVARNVTEAADAARALAARRAGNEAINAELRGAGVFRPKGVGYETGAAGLAAPVEGRGRAVTRALTTRPPANVLTPRGLLPEGAPAGVRRVRYNEAFESPRLSPNPGAALVQHAIDRWSELHPEVRGIGSKSRIGRLAPKTVQIYKNRIAALAVPFGEAARSIKVGSPEDVALGRIISYDPDSIEHAVELLDREIARHRLNARKPVVEPKIKVDRYGNRRDVQPEGTISPATKRNLEATADALEAARPFVENPSRVLQNAVEHGVVLSNKTTDMLVEGSHLNPETAREARNYRARVASGAHYLTPGQAQKDAAELRRQGRDLVKQEKATKRAVSRTMRSQIADEERAAAQVKAADKAADAAYRARNKARDAVDAAQRKVARSEERLYGAQFHYAAEGKHRGPRPHKEAAHEVPSAAPVRLTEADLKLPESITKDPRYLTYARGRPEVTRWGNEQARVWTRKKIAERHRQTRGATPTRTTTRPVKAVAGSSRDVMRHTNELRQARRELAQAKQALRIEVRKGKQIAARQRLAAHHQAKAKLAGMEARRAEADKLGRTMNRIGEGKRDIEGQLRDLQDKVGTIVGAEDVQVGPRAAHVASIPRTRTTTQRIGGGIPLGKKRKLVHQTRGVLQEQGREELSGQRIITSRYMQTAKRVVEDQIAKEKLDGFSIPIEKGGQLLPGHRLYNPNGYAVARRMREVPPDAILDAYTPAEIEKAADELVKQEQFVQQHVFPSEADYAKMTDEQKAGIRQIDERIAKGYAPTPTVHGDGVRRFLKVLDATNNITRAALIYYNPSYIPRNYVGNLAFLALHQGVFGAKNLARASSLLGDLDRGTLQLIDHEVGPGGARGLMEASTGRHVLTSERVTALQNRIADQGPRRAAWIHEAGVRGYNTPQKIHRLLTGKSQESREVLNQISLDARRAMVDFGDLNQFERSVIQRAVFIYPWLKGATRYGKDLAIDRPVSAAIAAHVLAARNDLQRRHGIGRIDPLLGHDIIPMGASRMVNGQRIQPVVNFQSINPVGQALDVVQAAKSAATGGGASSEALSQFLQPGLVAAGQSIFQDRRHLQSVPLTFAKELVGTPTRPRFPLGQTAQILLAGKPSPEEIAKRMYVPEHGPKAAFLQAVLGSARGRQLNVTKARATRMTASEKKIAALKTKRDAQFAALRKYKVKITPLGRKDLREAYDRRIAREEARAHAGITATNKGAEKGQEWQRDALVVDTRLALRRGWIPARFRNDAKWVIANAHKMEFDALHGDDVKKMLAAIDELAYGGGSAGAIAETAGQIHAKAGHK